MTLTLSGPGIDLTLRDGLGAALSRAVTAAERGRLDDASYYVRDGAGSVVSRVDRVSGETYVYANGTLDRAVGEGDGALRPVVSSPTRRPGPRTTKPKKEEQEVTKSDTKKKSSSAKRSATKSRSSRSGASPSSSAPAAAAAKATTAQRVEAPAEAAAGNELYKTLLAEVRSAVQGVETKPNKSHTYTRLLKGGKAFAYIFPPRKGGVAMKIPKQLLAVERELPEGHGFKKTGWGLTRTLHNASEAPVVAKALGVAAKAVAAK